jgi:hypothetical protein
MITFSILDKENVGYENNLSIFPLSKATTLLRADSNNRTTPHIGDP